MFDYNYCPNSGVSKCSHADYNMKAKMSNSFFYACLYRGFDNDRAKTRPNLFHLRGYHSKKTKTQLLTKFSPYDNDCFMNKPFSEIY